MAKKKSTLIIDGENKGAIKSIQNTTSSLGKAVNDVRGIGSGLTGALGGFTGLLTNLPFMAAAAATGMVAGFAMMIKNSIDTAEAFDKMSQRAGVSVEFLSTLTYSAGLAGSSIETLEKGIQRMSRNMFDAERGLLTAKIAFDELGISITDSDGKLRNGEEVLYDVADGFAEMEDGTKKTALALQIFGRAGAELIPMLNAGSEGLKKQREEARKLGLEVSTRTAKQAAEFKDNIEILEFSMKGAANVIAENLLPTLVSLSGNLVDVATNTNTVSILSEGLVTILKVLATAFIGLGSIVYMVGASLGTVGATIAKILTLDIDGAMDVWTRGDKKVREFGKAADEVLSAIWGKGKDYKEVLEEIQKAQELEKHNKELEQLAKQWESVNKVILNDIAKNTLPEISYRIHEIDLRFKEYSDKFPAHIELINLWKQTMINAAVDIEKALRETDIPGLIIPSLPQSFDILPLNQSDVDYYKSLVGQIAEENTKLTAKELVNIALREQATSDMFGNMAGAAQNFFIMSNQQNKAAFTLYKSFAIAQAGIDTYNSAIAAYRSLVGIPIVGPALAIAAAASATAFGVSNIARIASMQPGSGVSGISAGVSTPSIPSNTTNQNNDNRNISYQINIYGRDPGGDRDLLAREIIDSLNKAQEDGLLINR